MTSASSVPADQPAGLARGRRRGAGLAVLVVYAALGVALSLPVWGNPLTHYIGIGADPPQAMWYLAWTPFSIGHLHNPLLSDYMNYPDGFNLMWNTWMPAAGVVLWPITALWGPIAAYNVALAGGLALSAFFAFVAIRRLVPATIPATIGGLVYGFSPFTVPQAYGHPHMVLSAVTPPLALMLLHELLVRQRMRAWLLTLLIAGIGVLQFFIGEEGFVTEILMGAIIAVILALTHWSQVRSHLPYALRVLGGAMVITAVVLAVPVAVQFLGPNRLSLTATVHQPEIFVTDPLNLVLPTQMQWLSPAPLQRLTTHFTGNAVEWNSYLGLPLLVILLYAMVRFWRTPLVRATSLTALVITVLSFGPHLHIVGRITPVPLPWWIFAHIPVVDNIQSNRLAVYLYLAAGIGIAFVLHTVSLRQHPWLRSLGVATALTAVALVPLIPTFPLPVQQTSVPAYFTSTGVNRIPAGGVVLTAPWTNQDEPSAMVDQADTGMRFRLLSGYFIGDESRSDATVRATLLKIAKTGAAPVLDAVSRHFMLDELARDRVNVVIAGPSPQQVQFVAFLTELLGFPPDTAGGVDTWSLGAASPSP